MASLKKIAWLLLGALGAGGSPLVSAPATSPREELSAALLRAEKDPNSEFMLSVWQAGEGLPVNVIEEVLETPDGYLWLGTSQGLMRFDGLRFQSFFTTPTGLRYGARVEPLAVDGRGRLWLAPDQVGLIRREASGFTEVLTNGAVLRARAESLCSDGENHLFWVNANGGMGRVSTDAPNSAERIGGPAAMGWRWARDFKGKMWLIGPRAIRLYDGGKWRELERAGGTTLVAAPRRQGGLWVARQGKLRSLRANGESKEEAIFPWAGGGNRVTCLLEDDHNRLWVGTVSQGLFCYSGGQFKQVVPTACPVLCLFEDRQDNLWVGTRGGGLVRLRQRQFFVHDLRSGLENEFVHSLAQDQTGRVWVVSAERGLGWWQNSSWHKVGQAEKWPNFDAMCVLPSTNGGVWLATRRHGLWRSSDGEFSQVALLPRAPREPVVDLLEDRRGRLWMVTDSVGLYCLDGGKVSGYSTQQGLPSAYIRRIIEDEAGEIWAGDWEGGIVRWQDGHWVSARSSSGHGDAVRGIVPCGGALWIGTSAGGLLRLKDGQTARISSEQGLPDTCIQQMLLDGLGSLWCATPDRLFRVSLEQLNAVADGRREKVETTTYGRSDGMPQVSFAYWSDPRCWRTTEGELWFATANGALHFHPANLRDSKPPQALIEQTLLDGKPLTASALEHLRPGLGRLEFRFTAPCLTAPERVRFRYQMMGVDPDWVDGGTSRSATYASIPAGHRAFRVSASSPEGIWSSEIATVALAAHPYFWQSNWFLASVAATIAGSGVWLARRATVRRLNRRLEHLRQQHAVDRERARIAQDIHDELGANLTSIGLLADMGARHKTDTPALTRDLGQISVTARESVAAMDAIVWALNPRNDSLDNFANYIAQFTRDFFRPTALRTRLELPANLPATPMTTEMRHQLFLLVKESFNNIVRHAQATEVRLELACVNGDLHLTIADDGKGLSGPVTGEGQDGLTNLRERIERLGGTLRLGSDAGRGTRLDFALPLTRLNMY